MLNVTTRVVDDDMRDVGVGEVGEVVHRSPQVTAGYYNDPERTEAAFAGGWFHSGDLATVDADGYLTIVDRKKDMINSGGENVSSREVEEVLYRHPAVAEVAVVGIPDDRWIEAVCAVVVARERRWSRTSCARSRARTWRRSRSPRASSSSTSCPRTRAGRSSSASCAPRLTERAA